MTQPDTLREALPFWFEQLIRSCVRDGSAAEISEEQCGELKRCIDGLSTPTTAPEPRAADEKTALRFNPTGQKYAIPGMTEPVWRLQFADPDAGHNIYSSEEEAWAGWNQYAPSWNCWLFAPAEFDRSTPQPEAAPPEDDALAMYWDGATTECDLPDDAATKAGFEQGWLSAIAHYRDLTGEDIDLRIFIARAKQHENLATKLTRENAAITAECARYDRLVEDMAYIEGQARIAAEDRPENSPSGRLVLTMISKRAARALSYPTQEGEA
ncbi:MAG: hypothetical protein AAFW97_13125 [Pseudomonadota bacterium]